MEKKIIWGGLAGGVTFFILGFLFYGLLLKSFFAEHSPAGIFKEIPDFPILIVGNILMGFFYALILGSWAKASSPGDGAKKAFIMTILFSCGYDLMMYSTSNISTTTGMIGDIATTTVMGTIVGAVVIMVMGSSNKTA